MRNENIELEFFFNFGDFIKLRVGDSPHFIKLYIYIYIYIYISTTNLIK